MSSMPAITITERTPGRSSTSRWKRAVAFSPKQAESFSTRLPESPASSTPRLRPEPAGEVLDEGVHRRGPAHRGLHQVEQRVDEGRVHELAELRPDRPGAELLEAQRTAEHRAEHAHLLGLGHGLGPRQLVHLACAPVAGQHPGRHRGDVALVDGSAGGAGVRAAHDVGAADLHRVRQGVDGREEDAQERPHGRTRKTALTPLSAGASVCPSTRACRPDRRYSQPASVAMRMASTLLRACSLVTAEAR
jgi:hypothetical protein